MVGFLILIVVPVLVTLSWRAARDAPSRVLRNYFMGFRVLGLVFWGLCIYLTLIQLHVRSQAEDIVKGLLGK